MTYNEHGNAMLAIAGDKRNSCDPQNDPAQMAAARDLSLAITHLEDALTRYNSACYRLAGTWNRRDPDAAS